MLRWLGFGRPPPRPPPIVATPVNWSIVHPVELCWDLASEMDAPIRESKSLKLKRGAFIILLLLAVAGLFVVRFKDGTLVLQATKGQKYLLAIGLITSPLYLLLDQLLICILVPPLLERIIDRTAYIFIWLISVPGLVLVILYDVIYRFLN